MQKGDQHAEQTLKLCLDNTLKVLIQKLNRNNGILTLNFYRKKTQVNNTMYSIIK